MKQIKWLSVNFAICTLLYLWLFKGVEGAKNGFIFITWLYFITAVLSNSDHALRAAKIGGLRRPVPSWLDGSVNMYCILTLVWFGAWITAIGFTLQTILFISAYDKLEEKS